MNLIRVSAWSRPSHYVGKEWHGWYVGLGRNRESSCLSTVNFEVFLEKVLAASDKGSVLEPDISRDGEAMEIDTVYVVRESHWAVGWIEWIAIHESDKGALAKAEELFERLDDYPVLDEDKWSERETEEIDRFYAQTSFENASTGARSATRASSLHVGITRAKRFLTG